MGSEVFQSTPGGSLVRALLRGLKSGTTLTYEDIQVTSGAAHTRAYGSQSATYRAYGAGYTAYATPTDMIRINGSASKTVAVLNAGLAIQQTTGALQVVDFIKRSAANTGGTSSQATLNPLDSGSAAATATVDVYTAAPAALGAGTTLHTVYNTAAALTAAPTQFALSNGASAFPAGVSAVTLQKPIILRGAAEGLAINWKSAALPGGFTAFYFVDLVEYTE